jgi:molybdopterin synthase sulfur carrier subunit
MKVTIRFFGALREAIGSRQIDVETGPLKTYVRDLPSLLGARYGERISILLQNKEDSFDFLRVLINGQDHMALEGMDTELKDADIISLLPPLSGGIGKTL